MSQPGPADAVPTIDLTPWWAGSDADRAALAQTVDDALQRSGFMLVTGHRVAPALTDAVRSTSREFFALPRSVKRLRAAGPQGRGWLPPGVETNAYSEGTESPPDLKESLSYGADVPSGDPAVDARWYQPNPWPTEVPGLAGLLREYIRRMRDLSDDLLDLCALALGLPRDHFRPCLTHPTYTLNVNRYPPARVVGAPLPGQFRIGPHTDFGTLTVLDRQPGAGGLQVHLDDDWVDAPFHPGALTVNVGDLLARWTGDRWRSSRHRVLPPQESAPEEDLVSLAFFYECDPDALVESLPPPIGYRHYTSVYAADYLEEKYRALSSGTEILAAQGLSGGSLDGEADPGVKVS